MVWYNQAMILMREMENHCCWKTETARTYDFLKKFQTAFDPGVFPDLCKKYILDLGDYSFILVGNGFLVYLICTLLFLLSKRTRRQIWNIQFTTSKWNSYFHYSGLIVSALLCFFNKEVQVNFLRKHLNLTLNFPAMLPSMKTVFIASGCLE